MVEISALTDAQLNRAMIWLYIAAIQTLVEDYAGGEWDRVTCSDHVHIECGEGYLEASFLRDWNLTMPLAVENDCAFLPRKGDSRGLLAQVCINKPSGNYEYFEGESLRNPLRAICEVLVMIKLRDKQ